MVASGYVGSGKHMNISLSSNWETMDFTKCSILKSNKFMTKKQIYYEHSSGGYGWNNIIIESIINYNTYPIKM